jgi:hypothetical protein
MGNIVKRGRGECIGTALFMRIHNTNEGSALTGKRHGGAAPGFRHPVAEQGIIVEIKGEEVSDYIVKGTIRPRRNDGAVVPKHTPQKRGRNNGKRLLAIVDLLR